MRISISSNERSLDRSLKENWNKVTVTPSLLLGYTKAQSRARGRGNQNLNVNFKTVSGKRGDTIRPLTVDERRTVETMLGLRSNRM